MRLNGMGVQCLVRRGDNLAGKVIFELRPAQREWGTCLVIRGKAGKTEEGECIQDK